MPERCALFSPPPAERDHGRVRRLAAAASSVVLACAGSGCSSGPDCSGLSSVDQGVEAGQPTARAALEAVLAGHPKWVDQTGWRVGYRQREPNRTITFVTADGDKVEVGQSELNDRWYLDRYRGCH